MRELVLLPWERGTLVEAWRLWNAYAHPEVPVEDWALLQEVVDQGRTVMAALAHLAERRTKAGMLGLALREALRVKGWEGYHRWVWYWAQAYRASLNTPGVVEAVREGRYSPPDPPIRVVVSPRGESSAEPLQDLPAQGLGLLP